MFEAWNWKYNIKYQDYEEDAYDDGGAGECCGGAGTAGVDEGHGRQTPGCRRTGDGALCGGGKRNGRLGDGRPEAREAGGADGREPGTCRGGPHRRQRRPGTAGGESGGLPYGCAVGRQAVETGSGAAWRGGCRQPCAGGKPRHGGGIRLRPQRCLHALGGHLAFGTLHGSGSGDTDERRAAI